MTNYLGTAQPRTNKRNVKEIEPRTYEAAVQWLQARLANESTISFRQFYDEFLKPVLKTRYSHKGILEHLKLHHADEYKRIG